ncbi:hypothetical protein PsYK624_140870 [Phanerochaete sordida]|uniref:Myb/SANT-like domain-containing protein n=1 Tax=Phanerochaete sordida TaxID=48140 RepID=A0A9P3GM38_9APHY|nr:hypothetical protein PsYK624_140870 [Phanerochaete sordida]
MPPTRAVASWTAEDDALLADLLLEARAQGVPFTSRRDAFWEQAAARLAARGGRSRGAPKDATKCHARLVRKFKLYLADVESLRGELGVEWDADRKMLVASPERWEQLLMIHGRYKRFRDTAWPLYDKIKLLYSEAGDGQDDVVDLESPSNNSGYESNSPAFEPTPPPSTPVPRSRHSRTRNVSGTLCGLSPGSVFVERSECDALSSKPTNVSASTAALLSPSNLGSTSVQANTAPEDAIPTHKSDDRDRSFIAERRTGAIRLMEADDAYTVHEQVAIAELFEQRPAVVDFFLAISSKEARTLYIRRALSQHVHHPSARSGTCIIG